MKYLQRLLICTIICPSLLYVLIFKIKIGNKEKEAKITIVQNQDYNNGCYTEPDYNYLGYGLIAPVRQGCWQACRASAMGVANAHYWTFRFSSKLCWLKYSNKNREAWGKDDLISGNACCGEGCYIEPDYNYPDYDLSAPVILAGWEACRASATGVPNARYWTFRFRDRLCWLKSSNKNRKGWEKDVLISGNACCGKGSQVSCGRHVAASCSECGCDYTSCNGDCKWDGGKCTEKNASRDSGRCGMNYPAYNGKIGQCDPTANENEKGPCCSPNGWCGNSADHCNCSGCVNYAEGDLDSSPLMEAFRR